MWGRESFCKRNGHGIQEWPDGCKYEGEFVNKLKHGTGVFTWPSGEVCFTSCNMITHYGLLVLR